ncbi:hypothetical protein HMPREF0168_1166 [Bifidobacterium dentium ATCC 27679]|uniref:Uncharacterized protein n=1 Tax=Bifidobacterium dentium ATCC 27679 TaxID=871562 RepID=E0Q7Q8_9BIFI|nr:hypothetical protein HMPREF0168_1166 [Bifidobacterium dentium ATCC 27679]
MRECLRKPFQQPPRKSTLKALKRWQQPPETWQEPPFQAHSKTACFQRLEGPKPLETSRFRSTGISAC